jgi:phosphinothricin acetyltransferase
VTAPRLVPLTAAHWPAVQRIYAEGIAGGHATFETEPPSWEAFDASRLADHRIVALLGDTVVGWVACSPTSARAVYRGVVEHSVYVAGPASGRGVGRRLLHRLAASTEAAGIWTIQSGIFPENAASLALHHACGFRRIGVRSRVGLMRSGPCAGRWRDVVLVERRSEVAGVRPVGGS